MKRRMKVLFVFCLLCLISACGRVSRPVPPEGSTYPYPYIVSQES